MSYRNEFHIGSILSIVLNFPPSSDLTLAPVDKICETLNFMTGGVFIKSKLLQPSIYNTCKAYLSEQFPQFSEDDMVKSVVLLNSMLEAADNKYRNFSPLMALTEKVKIAEKWFLREGFVEKYGEVLSVKPFYWCVYKVEGSFVKVIKMKKYK